MKRKTKYISNFTKQKLEKFSTETRIDVLKMIQNAGSGNPGSALSCI